jgi:hypothetical protein
LPHETQLQFHHGCCYFCYHFYRISRRQLKLYVKGTDTQPAGYYEFKLADTIRSDKNAGDLYTFHNIGPEIEYDVTDKLTMAIKTYYPEVNDIITQ